MSGVSKNPLIMIPRTRELPSRLAAALRAQGASVVEITEASNEHIQPDIVLIPAAAAVKIALPTLDGLSYRPTVLAMGPRSAAAAEAVGWQPTAIAKEPTLEAFIALVGEYLTG